MAAATAGVLIVNAYGRSNRGDSVLLDECIAEIRTTYPDAPIAGVLFEGIEDARRQHPDIAWSERIGNRVAARSATAGRVQSIAFILIALLAALSGSRRLERLLPAGQQATLQAYRQSWLIVSAPGGYIHDTNFAYWIALLHVLLGRLQRKTVILAPQSIGPLDSVLAKRSTGWVLKRAQAICAREGYSYGFLSERLRLPQSLLHRTGDSAFWNDAVSHDEAKIEAELSSIGLGVDERFVGATVVGWDFPKRSNPREDYRRYVEGMARLARHIFATRGLRSVIFNQVSDDLPTALAVQALASDAILVQTAACEPPLLRGMIARAELFIGTRFHSCIFAMMAARPTLAVAYLPKTQFIMEDLRLPDRAAPIDDFSVDAMIALVDRDLGDLAGAGQEVREAVAAYRARELRFADVLRRLEKRA